MPKLTRIQAAKLREEYLLKRELLLQEKVDQLGITLFDKIFEKYLKNLDQLNGKLLLNNNNISMVRGLDAIYINFRNTYNAPIVKNLISDLNGIIPINEKYFGTITSKPTITATKRAITVVNKGLGLTTKGTPIKNGFIDQFLRDDSVIKKIKKQTVKALTEKKGFQQFRQELKRTIQGEDGKPLSGAVQQYYRNNAYDTFSKVDRIASEEMADELGLLYFFYTGGIITDSRPFCIKCNGKIINSAEFRHLTYNKLKPALRPGIPDGKKQTWHPLEDLGGYACRHRKDYVDEALAIRYLKTKKDQVLNINTLLSI